MTTSEKSKNPQSLNNTMRSSMVWNILETGVSQVSTMGVFIFLTFVLDPVVFGVFALAVIAIDYLQIQGRTAAMDVLIKRNKFDRRNMSSAFWVFAGVNAIGLAICFLVGTVLSYQVDEPLLRVILPALCLTLVPTVIEMPGQAHLIKQRDFKGIAIRNVLASGLGAIIAVITAFGPAPEWALVTQRATAQLVSVIFICIRANWFPGLFFNFSEARAVLPVWLQVFLSQALTTSLQRILELVVGVFLGAAIVGIMRVALRLIEAIYSILGQPLGRVWLLLVSESVDDMSLRSTLYRRLTHVTVILFVPVFSGIYLVSDELVAVALDQNFAQASDVLKVACIAALLAPFFYGRNAIFTAIGKFNLLVHLTWMEVALATIACLILVQWGLVPALCGLIIANAFRGITSVFLLRREMGTPFAQLWRRIYPGYIAAAVMAVGVLTVQANLPSDMPILLNLMLSVFTGVISFSVCVVLVFRAWLMQGLSVLLPEK